MEATPIEVLIAEDEEAHAEAICRALEASESDFAIRVVNSLSGYREQAASRVPHIAIVDLNLPDGRAMEVLISPPGAAPFPVVLMTSYGNEQIAVEALKSGALDYVVKSPESFASMPWTVARALREWDLIRERELAEAALYQSGERFRAMFDTASVGVSQADPVTRRFQWVNQKMCAITGYSAEELLETSSFEITHPEDRERDQEAFLRLMRGETSDYRLEKRYLRKDGSVAWVNVNLTVIRDASGQPLRDVGVVEDITARKQAEDALRASEAQYRLLHESMMDAFASIDMEGRIRECNDSFCRMLGYTAEEMLTMTYLDLTPKKWHDFEVNIVRNQILVRGYSDLYEKEYRRKDGSVFPIEIRSVLVRDNAGQPSGIWGIIRDISLRKSSERALKEEADRRRILFEQSRDGIVVLDENGKVYEANRQYAQMLGYSAEEVLQLHVWDWDTKWSRVELLEMLRKVDSSGEHIETGFRRKDGSVLQIEVASTGNQWAGRKLIFCVCRDVSDRKRADAALRESEARYRQLFNEAIEGLALADAETGTLLDCNRAFLRLTGYAREELIGQPQSMLHPPEGSHPVFSKSFAAHRGDKAGEVLEDLLLTKSSKILEVEIKANTIQTAGRKAIIGSFHDITENRRGQREREITLDLLRRLNAPSNLHELVQAVLADLQKWTGCEAVGIRLRDGDDYPYFETRGFPAEFVKLENHLCKRDTGGQVVRDDRGNPVVQCMCGNVLCGRFDPALPFFTQKGSFWSNCTTDLLATTTDADRQTRTRDRCNGEGYESVALFPLIHGGRTVGLLQVNDKAKGRFTPELLAFLEQLGDQIAVAIAHRQAEEALHESEKLYRVLVENAAEVVMVLQDGMVRFINQEGEAVSGYTREELMARPFLYFAHSDDRARIAANHMRRLRGESVSDGDEARIVAKDGTVRDLQIKAARILWKGAPATLNFLTDVTEHKRAEEERQRMEAELQQTRKMEAVGQLAGGVAHDFNNLLTVIQGYSGMLLTDMAPEDPNRDLVADINDAGGRAASLTRQLLAFSRKQVLEPKVLNLNEVVSNVEKMLRRLIGENIVLTTILSPAVSCVMVDPGQMEQVVINLAVNARDAMPQGGRLTIETNESVLDEAFCRQRSGSGPGRYVRLSISDTGQGMSPEIQERIFEPFFTTKGVGKGTGLGLATVFGIVKQSDGYIEVESKEGAGSCFRIYLPAVDPAQTDALSGEATGAAPHGSETILLVEDEKSVRRVASRALRTYGYNVIEKEHGQSAIEYAESAAGMIDLLLTDVVMPGIGGQQLAERLRKQVPGLKVIFMSGYTDDSMFQQDLMIPNTAFIRKPFELLSLARKVRDALDGKE